nr:MAG TPA: tail collar fiber protein [Caudoviricetes sp.]
MIINPIIGGTGGMTAEIFVTGLSETDTVTCTKDGKTMQRKWINKTNPAVSVPAGYTQLEYIESRGTQYIDTNIKPTGSMDFEVTAYVQSSAAQGTLFSGGDNYNSKYLGVSIDQVNPGESDIRYDSQRYKFTLSSEKFMISKVSNKLLLNNVEFATCSVVTFTSDYSIRLFAYNRGGNIGEKIAAKLYSLKFSNNGSDVANFIPAKRNSDGVVGLYDLISKTFFTNAGTGTFTAGSEIPSATSGWLFDKLKEYGTYTITATNGTDTVSEQIEFPEQSKSVELALAKIYGISRDITNSSPVWARTDKAVGMTATATVGDTAGNSDFNNCYPWSGIVRETLSTGDVMVKIPKFYFQRYREGNVEHIRIADKATSGFTLHPLFNHGGVESECAYIGAYKTSSDNKSVSGASPQVSQTRATMRNNAKAKGTGWSLIDIAALSAIQMLILVEFANNNVQSVIGRGYCDSNRSALSTGTCDNVSGLTGRPVGTDGKVDVVWRGIEGFWGNIWEWVDGVNWLNGNYYVCNNPSKYADDTTTDYNHLSFVGSIDWNGYYITEEGLDITNNHVILPMAVNAGNSSTYECDACWASSRWCVMEHGGTWNSGSYCGLFTAGLYYYSNDVSQNRGSRLLYIPS